MAEPFTYGLAKGSVGASIPDPGPAALEFESDAYGKLKVTQLTAPLYEYMLDRTDEPQVSGNILALIEECLPAFAST